MPITRIRVLLALASIVVASAGAIIEVHAVHWRAVAVYERAVGRLPVDWSDLFWMMRPHPEVMMGEPPNPYAKVTNPHTTPTDVADGERLFNEHCAGCHGIRAQGGHGGPSLHDRTFQLGRSDWALYRTITHGIPNSPMVGWDLGRNNVWHIVAYLNGILGRGLSQAGTAAAPGTSIIPVTAEELIHAERNPGEWLSYSGSYSGQRHSSLRAVTRDNVQRLTVSWVRQLPSKDGSRLETSPIVRGTTMYVTALPGAVYALDTATGRVLWKYNRDVTSRLALCCEGNRGVAVLGDSLFVGTLDAHLISINANTGIQQWDVTVADSAKGYGITAAPLVVGDMVITGIAGGEFATRGFLVAYDAATGKQRWRFETIPAPGQPGGESWEPDAYKTGGAPTWMTGSYDPELGLLYWGVGNPNPNFYGDSRKGDNLYSESVVAVEVATGRLRWYFQFTPHDTHDWDSAQIPVLIDHVDGLPGRKLLAWANRNGFYYLLDRETGKFLAGAPFVRQNWADGLDLKGRPTQRLTATPTIQGVRVYPHSTGATNWWSPSYDSESQLLYVPTLDHGSLITAAANAAPVIGEEREGSVQQAVPDELTIPAVKALDAKSGRVVWQHVSPSRRPIPEETGSLMSTAGGLVFGGDLEEFFALDAKTGSELWHFNAGGTLVAPPVTYMVDGRQYIAMTAGDSIYAFTLAVPNESKSP